MKISIIIPVYNTEKYIDKCLESCLNQTFDDYEIILIDDGSKDSSPEKCDEWAGKSGFSLHYSIPHILRLVKSFFQ